MIHIIIILDLKLDSRHYSETIFFFQSVPHLISSSPFGTYPLSFKRLALFCHSSKFGMTVPNNRHVTQSGPIKGLLCDFIYYLEKGDLSLLRGHLMGWYVPREQNLLTLSIKEVLLRPGERGKLEGLTELFEVSFASESSSTV